MQTTRAVLLRLLCYSPLCRCSKPLDKGIMENLLGQINHSMTKRSSLGSYSKNRIKNRSSDKRERAKMAKLRKRRKTGGLAGGLPNRRESSSNRRFSFPLDSIDGGLAGDLPDRQLPFPQTAGSARSALKGRVRLVQTCPGSSRFTPIRPKLDL